MVKKILVVLLSREQVFLLHRLKTYLLFIFTTKFIWLSLAFFFVKKITPSKRKTKIIVSLTSIPPRLNFTHFAIKSILRQTVLPDRIILWLSREHKNKEFKKCSLMSLPKNLIKLQKKGLEIFFVKDLGSYRKLLPALNKFSDSIVITIDDDILYPKNMIASLYSAYLRNGNGFVYCRRSRIIEKTKDSKYVADKLNFSSKNNHQNLFITGGAGALYPPKVLNDEVFNESIFARLAPDEDDSWFNAMRLLNKNKVFQVEAKEIEVLPSAYAYALYYTNTADNRKKFNRQFNDIFNYYQLFSKDT